MKKLLQIFKLILSIIISAFILIEEIHINTTHLFSFVLILLITILIVYYVIQTIGHWVINKSWSAFKINRIKGELIKDIKSIINSLNYISISKQKDQNEELSPMLLANQINLIIQNYLAFCVDVIGLRRSFIFSANLMKLYDILYGLKPVVS